MVIVFLFVAVLFIYIYMLIEKISFTYISITIFNTNVDLTLFIPDHFRSNEAILFFMSKKFLSDSHAHKHNQESIMNANIKIKVKEKKWNRKNKLTHFLSQYIYTGLKYWTKHGHVFRYFQRMMMMMMDSLFFVYYPTLWIVLQFRLLEAWTKRKSFFKNSILSLYTMGYH